jgi:GR25 family glycosyltransferase involved in LPS biosynthesis
MIHDLPRTFVLTVKPTWNKWLIAEQHLKDRGIPAEPFLCIDRKLCQLNPILTFDVNKPGEQICSSQVIACLSHYLIWKVMSYLPDDSFWVLEDDCQFDFDWRHQYSEAMSVLPDDWDLVFIGSCCCEGRPTIPVGKNLYEVQWPMCGHGIMYRKKSLPVLLEVHQKIWAPLDIAMFMESLPKLRVYTILPRIVNQRDTTLLP